MIATVPASRDVHRLVQELAAAIAAASNGAAPVGGAAAAAVLQELHRLAAGGPLEAPPSAPEAEAGSAAVAVAGAEAAAMQEAVGKAAEPGSHGVLRSLDAVLEAVRSGGTEVRSPLVMSLACLEHGAAGPVIEPGKDRDAAEAISRIPPSQDPGHGSPCSSPCASWSLH